MNLRAAREERLPLLLLGGFAGAVMALHPSPMIPDICRSWCALGLVLVIPGAALALLFPGGPRSWLAVLGLSIPLSLGCVLFASLFGVLFRWGAMPLAAAYLLGSFLLCVFSLLRGRSESAPAGVGGPSLPLFLLLLGFVVGAMAQAPTFPATDGPDHVATVDEILLTQELFPRQGLVPPGEVDRTDPRKGVFHVALALSASLAQVTASQIWRAAPAVLAVGWLAIICLLGFRLGLGHVRSVLAGLLALIFVGGYTGPWLVRLGYGAHIGLCVALAATWVALGFLEERGKGTLALLGMLSAIAVAVHPMAPAFLFFPFLVMLPFEKERKGRVAALLSVALLLATPLLVWRFLETRGTVNPLHLSVMPVFSLADGWGVLDPHAWVKILGWHGILGILVTPWVTRDLAPRRAGNYLLAASISSVTLAWTPGVFDAAGKLASSLPIKLLYLAPFPFTLSLLLFNRRWKGRDGVVRGLVAAVLLVSTPAALTRLQTEWVQKPRPEGLDAALDAVRRLPGGSVVAADPWVSSWIAAETPAYPVTVYHQHGHPMDARGLDRLNALGAILSPWRSPNDDLPILDAFQVDYVLVPDRPQARWWPRVAVPGGGDLDSLRYMKFAKDLVAYEPVFRAGGWGLFAFRQVPSPNLPVIRPVLGTPGGIPVAVEDGRAESVRLVAVEAPERIPAGERAPLVFWWRREGDGGWPVEVNVRLVAATDRDRLKPVRLIRENPWNPAHRVSRHREIVSPFAGAWPGSCWPTSAAVAETVYFQPAERLKPGEYDLSVKVLPKLLFGNITLHDVLFEADQWQGERLRTVVVEPPIGDGS